MALNAVSARTARNLSALNDPPFIHALCDFREYRFLYVLKSRAS